MELLMKIFFKIKAFRFAALLTVLCLSMILAVNLKAVSKEDYDFSSPYSTLKLFYDNMVSENYYPEIAALALNYDQNYPTKAKKLVIKLKKILDAKSFIIKYDKIPRNGDYLDSSVQRNIYTLSKSIPEIYLEKKDDAWFFSQESIDAIDRIYQRLYPFETSKLIDSLPSWTKEEFLTVELWQYIGFALLLIASFIFYMLLCWIFGHLLVRFVAMFKYKVLAEKYIKPVSRPFSLILMFLLFSSLLPMLLFSAKVMIVFSYIIGTAVPVFMTVIAYRLMDLVSDVLAKIASKTETTVDDNLVPLARKILKIIVVILGIIYTVQNLHIDVTPLIAGVSIGGLAFALAAQDTIKNLFGSITLFTDKPFEVGDWIIFDKFEGEVEEVGIRSTRIRSFAQSLISIPNGKLSDMTIDNMGKRDMRRFRSLLEIPSSTPTNLIDKFVIGVRAIIDANEGVEHEKTEVHLYEIKENSLTILMHVFFNVDNWSDELLCRHSILSKTLDLAMEIGVKLTHPQEVLLKDEKTVNP